MLQPDKIEMQADIEHRSVRQKRVPGIGVDDIKIPALQQTVLLFQDDLKGALQHIQKLRVLVIVHGDIPRRSGLWRYHRC